MQFKDLKMGDFVYILHSNNTFEKEIIAEVNSHGGLISMKFSNTNLTVRVESEKSIFFDEENDVVVFSNKHNLFKD